MSTKTGLFREFAKAFARKTAYVLFWIAFFLVAGIVVVGGTYVATEIASFILSSSPLEETGPTHMGLTLVILVVFVGLVRIAHSAWVEAKTVTKKKS